MDWIRCPISAQEHADAIAIWTQDSKITYRELHSLVSHFAAIDLPDHPIAFISRPSIETIAFFFSLWRRQKLAFPLSIRLPEQAIENILQVTGAKIIFPNCSHREHRDCLLHLSIPSTLLLTSGTTATPKIACHTLYNHFHSARAAISLLDIQPGDRYLLDLPLNHVGGLAVLFRTFLAGATLLLNPPPIEPTHFSLVPTQLYRLLKTGNVPKKAKCLLIGGAPLSPKLFKEACHFPLYRSYGMTETSSMIALQSPNQSAVLPEAKISIQQGEIYVRGPMLFQGYYQLNAPLKIPLVNGWFPTRDLGRITSKGAVEWLGRKDRQFISGGENIQPEEIEALLLEYPGVLEAYVRPIFDEELGFRVVASLVCDRKIDRCQLETKLRTQLPGYKIPKDWQILSDPLKGCY